MAEAYQKPYKRLYSVNYRLEANEAASARPQR
jgi:hypothetical protein